MFAAHSGDHAIDHVAKSPCEATCSQMRGEHVLHLGLPASQPPIDTQTPTEGQQDNSSNTAALCREQSSILITNALIIFIPKNVFGRNVTCKHKESNCDIEIEKSISTIFVSTTVDNTSREMKMCLRFTCLQQEKAVFL